MSETKTIGIRSFTLVELLIVIAILAILSAAVVVVLNPAELLAQSRDSQRISDVNMMKKAVDLFIVDNSMTSLGTANRVYISLPDSSSSCLNIAGLPTLPATWQYVCAPVASLRNTDGTGWLPLNFSLVKGGSPIPYLPIDPQNDPSLTKYYQYIPGTNTFELTALMESEKQAKAAGKDGGTDAGRLEVGSDVSLWSAASGLTGYWNMVDGSGSLISDVSGNDRDGNIFGATWGTDRFGSPVGALSFDGVDDYARTGTIPISDKFSFSVWFKPNVMIDTRRIYWGGGSDKAILALSGTSGNLTWYMATSGGNTGYKITSSRINTSGWNNVVLQYDGSQVKCFINGVQDAVTASVTGTSTASVINLGTNYNNTGNWFNGLIDDVASYNRTLSVYEIQSIYNSGK